MKKFVMACLGLAAVLTSCSDDDTSGANNSSPLVSTTQTMYEEGEVTEIYKAEYDNGRMTKYKWFSAENVQAGYTDLTYNNNLLTSVVNYVGDVEYSSTDYNYDTQGRMTQSHYLYQGGQLDATTIFTHNSNNTITSDTQGSFTETRTFHLNNSGLIYKEVNDDNTYEFTLDGSTPISLSHNGAITTFEHDAEHNPSFININLGTGNFKPNAVLRANSLSDAIMSISDKYIIKETDNFSVNKYVYTFNEQGLPIKMKHYYNDILISQMEYFYQ